MVAASGQKQEHDEGSTPRPRRLLYLVKRCYSATKARLDEIARVHDLTTGDYTMLSFLKRLEPCSAAQLSREQKITPQAATQQVAQLRNKGMVTSQENEANRRISLISMTELGRSCLAAMSAEARLVEEEMLTGFSPAERETILSFLEQKGNAADGR